MIHCGYNAEQSGHFSARRTQRINIPSSISRKNPSENGGTNLYYRLADVTRGYDVACLEHLLMTSAVQTIVTDCLEGLD